MNTEIKFSKKYQSLIQKMFTLVSYTYSTILKKRALILSALLVIAQLASPLGIIVTYAAPTTSNDVGSTASLDPVGNKATRLQTQGASGVDQSSGALTYSYPITIPEGRNGMSPKLALSYNSQNNESGWFGYGWTVSIPYIERTTKMGSDKMYSNPAFVSSLHGELLSKDSNLYEQKIDDGSYAKYIYTGSSWQMTDRDGTVYYFGNTTSSRIDNASSTRIGRWYLAEVRDKFGNGIVYSYTKDSGTIYPASISYTEHALAHPLNLVTFNLENKNDKTISYKYGFRTVDTKRVSYIKTSTNGKDNSYFTFNYVTGSNGVRSLLESVEEKRLGTNDDWLTVPKTVFEYENSPVTFSGAISNSTNPYGSNSVIDVNNDGILDLHNAGDGYFPVDINGDYKKDLMQSDVSYGAYSNDQYINFKYNQGGSFYLRSLVQPASPAYQRSMSIGQPAPPLRFMGEGNGYWSQESAVVDINGDGFEDIIYNDVYAGNGVAINTTNNTFDYSVSSNFTANISDIFVDINGDNLLDRVIKTFTSTSTLYTAHLNNSNGYSTSSDFTYDAKIAQSGFDIGVKFIDVNNDGLVDIVRSYSSNYSPGSNPTCTDAYSGVPNPAPINQSVNEFYINKGDGFKFATSTLDGYLVSYTSCNYWYTSGYLVSKTTKEYDTNGDLTTDYDGATNNTAKQDVLKKVTSSLGSTLEASYTWTTKTGLNPNLPVPIYIVATTTDKLSVSDANPHSVGYSFSGGRMYFDASNPRDHKFAGFSKVDVVDGKNKTTTYYHQGNGDDYITGEKGDSYYNIGRAYRTDVFDLSTGSSTLVSKNLSLYTTYSYASSSFTYLDSQITNAYSSGGSFVSSGSKNVYDETKRLIKLSYNYNDIEPFTSFASSTIADKGTDILITSYEYSNARPQRLVKQVTTDYTGKTVSNLNYYYDNLPLGLVDKGAVTSVFSTVYKSDGTVSSTSTTASTYDPTGNVIQTIDNLNNKTTIIYDPLYFFPITKVDAQNGTTTVSYDPYTLNVLTIKGPDGITYTKETDGLGRVTRSYTVNSVGGIFDDTRTSYVYGGGITVYGKKIGDAGAVARSLQVYDSYGRLIQSKSETSQDVFSTQDTTYDASSNIISTSLPYTTTGYGLTTEIPSNGGTVYTYDGLGRVITKSSFGTTLSYQYGARSLTVQDNASTQHKKSYVYDASGNLSQVNEYNGGSTYTTNYNYTPFNKLSRITDANGNIRNFSYLSNGSLVYQEDPHVSTDTTFTTYSYTYDSLGNIITKAGQLGTTTYAYDALNRPTSRTLSDVNYGTSTVSIAYTGCSNNYSSPCTINRSTSSTTLAYSSSGKLSSETLSIDGKTFTRSYAYDTFGNPTTITYPDNGKTVYTYTLDGKQSTLSYITPSGATKNVITGSIYNSLGALSSLTYGNGVQMCNTYTNTSSDGVITPKLAKSAYIFNTTGCGTVANQIELYKDEFTYKDNLTPSSVLSTYKDIVGTTHTKSDTFTYDNLARLTGVSTSYDGGGAIVNTLVYDPIGNILKENDVLYRYSQDGMQNAHAVTSVGGTHITYDAQGNRIQVGDSAYAWNALNQIVSATTTNGTEFYTYDENGERIKKVVQATTVINQNVTPSTSTSTLSGFRAGDLLAQVENSTTYIATSTYNTLSALSLLSTSTLTTLVTGFYSSPFISKFCATSTSTTNRQNCIVTTTQELVANNINSRSTSTIATTGLVSDIINIVTGAYLIPSTYIGLATSSIATSATTTFSINSGTISSYNTYVATGIVVPMAEYANVPYVSSSTYNTLIQVGLTDTSKVRALLTLSGCNSLSSACTTAQKVVFERMYKNSGYLLSDKVLQEMWYVFAAKARLPGNSSEFTSTSTTLGSITIPTVTGLSVSSATSTYYSGIYFTTEFTNQSISEPRLQFFNTIPYYITQTTFTELQAAGITQTTIENYQALINDLLNIRTASSTEYMVALGSFALYDKKVTLSSNTLKELYLVVLGAATIPNNLTDYIATSIFDLSSYLTINSYQYNGYTGTWPFYASGCYAGHYTGSGSTPWTRCVITTSSFSLPVATSSAVSYILTVSKTPQPTEWPLVVGNSVSVSAGVNQTYTSTVASDGSYLDANVSPTIVARLAGSTSTIIVANSHEFITGSAYPYQAESVVLKAYVNTPRLTLASTTLIQSLSQYLVISSTSTIPVVATTSLAAYYKLDESSGNATDSTGNGYTLTNNGSATYAASVINNGVSLGSSNTTKYLSSTSNYGITGTSMSVSLWASITGTIPNNGNYFLAHLGDAGTDVEYILYYSNNGGVKQLNFNRVKQNITNNIITVNQDLGTNVLHHIVMTYDGATSKLYYDGTLIGSLATSGNGASAGISGFRLGTDLNGPTWFTSGVIDEASVWSRALSGTEVIDLYNSGTGIQYPFIVNATTTTEIMATSTYTDGIQSSISSYFGESYDSSNDYFTATTTASSSILFVSPEAYTEFASTTLRDSYDISRVFLATTTEQCVSNASTTECDKQVRKELFRTIVGNLSGFIPSQAATEEFWMVHKGLLTLPSITSTSTAVYRTSTASSSGQVFTYNSSTGNFDTGNLKYSTSTQGCSVGVDDNAYNSVRYNYKCFLPLDIKSDFFMSTHGSSTLYVPLNITVAGMGGNAAVAEHIKVGLLKSYNYYPSSSSTEPVLVTLATTTSYKAGYQAYNVSDAMKTVQIGDDPVPTVVLYFSNTNPSISGNIYVVSAVLNNPVILEAYNGAFSRSRLSSSLATSTATTTINLSLVPQGILSNLQFNTLYSSSTFALATSTRIVSEDTYNELLQTPVRINSDVDTIFNYVLSSATSSCSGQSATSSCVITAMKTSVKNTVGALSGFVLSDSALEELYRVYTNQLSIIPVSLINAVATTSLQTITLPLSTSEAFTTFSTTTAGTSTSILSNNGSCSFGTQGATTSRCYINLPYINSTVNNLILSYDVSTSTIATSTVIAYLSYITQTNASTTNATATPTFTTTISTSTIVGQKVSGTKFTFDLTSLYQSYLSSNSPNLILIPDANGTSTSIYGLFNPSFSITRSIVVPKINYAEFGAYVGSTTVTTLPVVSTSSLVAYYKLDESSGNASGSIGTNTLTNYDSSAFSNGKINNGASFGSYNTTKSFYTANNLGINGGAITISAWFKPDTLANGQGTYIVFQGDSGTNVNQMIYYDNNAGTYRLWFNRQRQNVANDGVLTNYTLTVGNWYHLVYTYDGSNIKGYINGNLFVGPTSSSGNGSAGGGSQMSIGGYYAYGAQYKNSVGATDEVGVWSTALSSTEIYNLYNQGIGRQYPFPLQTYASTTVMAYGVNSAQPVPFDRSTISSFATSTATTTIDLTSAPTLDLSMVFASPVGRISSGNSTSYTTSVIATTSIVGYYKLDESSGNPSDSSNNGKTLTNTGTVTYTTGKINNGPTFDSSNKRLGRTSDNMGYTTTSSNTWSFWVNPTTLSGYMLDNYTQSGGQRRAIVYIDGSASKFRTYLSGYDNPATGPTLTAGNWYHVALVNSAGTYTLYVNGVSYGTQGSGTSGGALDQFAFGAASDSWGANANAKFDEVSLWSRSLSSAEVANLYNSGTGLQYPFQTTTTSIGTSTTVYAGGLVDPTYNPLPIIPQNSLPALQQYPSSFATSSATSTIYLSTIASTSPSTIYSPFSSFVDSSSTISTYFTLNGVLVGFYTYQKGDEVSTGKITYGHTNYLGTPVIETDDRGDIVQMDITDVFGNYVMRDQRNDNALHTKGYTSHEFDDVTGNLYAKARYLNTPSHSFLSVDPMLYKLPEEYLRDPQQMNSYAYARNNPIIYTDPTGEIAFLLPALPYIAGFLMALPAISQAVNAIMPSLSTITSMSAQGAQQTKQATTLPGKIIAGTGIVPIFPAVGSTASVASKAGAIAQDAKPILKTGVSLAEQMGNKSFSSFGSLKTAVNEQFAIPKGVDLHHIVEQGGANAKQFSQGMLQNTKNIVPLAQEQHRQITRYFGSKTVEGFSRTRDFVRNMSFEDQFTFGQEVLDLLK